MELQDNVEEEFVELIMECSTISEFPINFPHLQICDLIVEVSSVLGCRKDYLLMGLCMAVSAVIGKKISLKDRAYINYPSLWVILLGTAGVNKTSPLQWALSPVEDLIARYADEFQKEVKAYNKHHDENQLFPVCKEFILKDTTHEKRLMTLCENETLLQFNDELAELLGAAERYNKNGDIANWLSILLEYALKMNIHVLRFALLVQIMKNPQCEYVDEECMRYSIQAMSYFQKTASYVYSLLTEGENKPLDKSSIILSLVNDYKIPQVKVAELFGVNKQNINEIIRRHKRNNIDHWLDLGCYRNNRQTIYCAIRFIELFFICFFPKNVVYLKKLIKYYCYEEV